MNTERLIKLDEVKRRTAKGKTAIYEGIKNHTFPKPVKDGNSSAWVESEIQKYIDDRIRARDLQQAAA